ncbi:hypothetical protein [Hydrocarboniphaga effusa]|uniref:hypothetical protein n=1 Tax=Hydrocarboniphaga effusa TaxID=243629 RepID=UPI003BA94924
MSKVSHTRKSRSLAQGRLDFSSKQTELFSQLENPNRLDSPNASNLDIHHELMGACHAALKEARERTWTRERVVDRMNQALPEGEKPITLRKLNSWMADSKEFHDMPARYLPAFCWATGSDEPLRALGHALGLALVDERELAVQRLGDLQVQGFRQRRETAALLKTLGG